MNDGEFRLGRYIKKVRFSKAVLWKNRQISLNKKITDQFRSRGTREVVFVDEGKGEKWVASVGTLRQVAVYKKEGQESQWYFPITVFRVQKLKLLKRVGASSL